MLACTDTNGIFAHLHCHSCYSFLDGGSRVGALVRRAVELGQPALALTDHDNTAAAVKFTELCDQYRIRPILGAELTLEDSHLTLLARNRQGYANICTLITKGYTAGGRLTPKLPERTSCRRRSTLGRRSPSDGIYSVALAGSQEKTRRCSLPVWILLTDIRHLADVCYSYSWEQSCCRRLNGGRGLHRSDYQTVRPRAQGGAMMAQATFPVGRLSHIAVTVLTLAAILVPVLALGNDGAVHVSRRKDQVDTIDFAA